MVWRLTEPTDAWIRGWLTTRAPMAFTYPQVGATAGTTPPGWRVNSWQQSVGSGPEDFVRARDALRHWTQLQIGWARGVPLEAGPVSYGSVVGVVSKAGRFWVVVANRVVYVTDESDRYAFAYGTLPGHLERGEERFEVRLAPDGDVVYSLLSFTRPATLLSRLADRRISRVQAAFARHTARAVRRAVELTPPPAR